MNSQFVVNAIVSLTSTVSNCIPFESYALSNDMTRPITCVPKEELAKTITPTRFRNWHR
jgi:hypothetical protein